MTHTLHRRGSVDSMSRDYVFICIPAKGFNDQGSDAKLAEFLRISLRHKPVNIGCVPKPGNMYANPTDDIIAQAHGVAHAVYDNEQAATAFLKDLVAADLGISIVFTGLLDKVNECCKKAGLTRHTVEYSLGLWGNTDDMPEEDVLQVTTMCGHGMLSPALVRQMVDQVRRGQTTAREVAETLGSQCTCGVFNPSRAAELIDAMAHK